MKADEVGPFSARYSDGLCLRRSPNLLARMSIHRFPAQPACPQNICEDAPERIFRESPPVLRDLRWYVCLVAVGLF